MDLDLILAAQAVVRLRTVRGAADSLDTTQPTVSRQIRRLEEELGVTLFRRTGRGMTPTPEGRIFLDRTRDIPQQLRAAREAMQQGDTVAGAVAIGMIPTLGRGFLDRLIAAVVREYPAVRLRLVEDYSAGLIERLHTGRIDLAVIYGSASSIALDAVVVGDEQLVCIAPPGMFPRGPVEISALLSAPLALPSTAHGLRALIDGAAYRAGATVEVLVEADSLAAISATVVQGLAATVLPEAAVEELIADGRVVVHPFVADGLRRPLAIARADRDDASRAADAVRELMIAELKSYLRSIG